MNAAPKLDADTIRLMARILVGFAEKMHADGHGLHMRKWRLALCLRSLQRRGLVTIVTDDDFETFEVRLNPDAAQMFTRH